MPKTMLRSRIKLTFTLDLYKMTPVLSVSRNSNLFVRR